MKTGKIRLNEIGRYHFRDIESKEILHSFRTCGGAFMYQESMRHSLGGYYEIYDTKTNSIVSDSKVAHVQKRTRVREIKNKKRSLIENMNKIGKSMS